MTKGIRINGKHSYDDYALFIASSNIGVAKIKKISEAIPYRSGNYDFTYLNGEPAWEPILISYEFDIVGETIEEMYATRSRVIDWLIHVNDADIYDDEFPDWHFHGDFDDISWSEDAEQGSIKVSFLCYPMMIKNESTVKQLAVGSHTIIIDGESVVPTATTPSTATITINNSITTVTGTSKIGIPLVRGENAITIEGDEVTLTYTENQLR